MNFTLLRKVLNKKEDIMMSTSGGFKEDNIKNNYFKYVIELVHEDDDSNGVLYRVYLTKWFIVSGLYGKFIRYKKYFFIIWTLILVIVKQSLNFIRR